MDSSFEVKLVIPLIPLYRGQLHHKDYVDEAINEIINLSNKLEFNIPNVGSFKLEIFIIKDYTDVYFHKHDGLAFKSILPTNQTVIETFNDLYEDDYDCINKLSIYEHKVKINLEKSVYRLLILSQIAKPGTIKTRTGNIYFNNVLKYHFDSFVSIQRESLDDINEIKWPNYKNLTITNVIDWFESNNFTIKKISSSKTEIAINSFTHLFREDLSNTILDLVWSLIGIEALYCKGNEGLSDQIFTKTQIFLGEITEYKSKLKKMYNFRSRLIHGDLNITPHRFYEDSDSFSEELYQSTIFAVAILTSTLQNMVFENRNSLDFKYNLQ